MYTLPNINEILRDFTLPLERGVPIRADLTDSIESTLTEHLIGAQQSVLASSLLDAKITEMGRYAGGHAE